MIPALLLLAWDSSFITETSNLIWVTNDSWWPLAKIQDFYSLQKEKEHFSFFSLRSVSRRFFDWTHKTYNIFESNFFFSFSNFTKLPSLLCLQMWLCLRGILVPASHCSSQGIRNFLPRIRQLLSWWRLLQTFWLVSDNFWVERLLRTFTSFVSFRCIIMGKLNPQFLSIFSRLIKSIAHM